MPLTHDRTHLRAIHPFHAVLLAGALPLFLGALLNDWAYWSSQEIQWSNFASWLIAGALVLTGGVLVFAVVDLFRAARRGRHALLYFLVVLATWVLGFINALVHGQDAWGIMPEALVLSVIVAVLACVATWLGFTGNRAGGVQ